MSVLDSIATAYVDYPVIRLIVVPAILCAIAYYAFKRRDEFTYHALQNTVATLAIVGLNYVVIIFFVVEINGYAQLAYQSLGIPTLPADFWQSVPFWLVCVLGVVAKDFVDYWNHRFMHTTWFWPTHAAHHSDTHVNAFTTFRVHFLESIVMSLSYIILLTWLQMPEAIPVVVLFTHVHNLYVHTNLPFQHGPLKLLIASPVFHRWHHADVKEAYGKNLANTIPAWDALFGTYYAGGHCTEKMGALSCGIEDKNPFLIFIYPFKRWAFLVRTRIFKRAKINKISPGQSAVTAAKS